MKSISVPILLALLATSVTAQTSSDDAAQRQLREDRERFSREVERQSSEASIRESQNRAAENEQRTREQLERLRAEQSAHTSATQILKQQPAPSTPIPPRRINEVAKAASSPTNFSADFAVLFLADGNCVVSVKGGAPEVKSPADAKKLLEQLLASRPPSPSSAR